jgi:hypothetical protein
MDLGLPCGLPRGNGSTLSHLNFIIGSQKNTKEQAVIYHCGEAVDGPSFEAGGRVLVAGGWEGC